MMIVVASICLIFVYVDYKCAYAVIQMAECSAKWELYEWRGDIIFIEEA